MSKLVTTTRRCHRLMMSQSCCCRPLATYHCSPAIFWPQSSQIASPNVQHRTALTQIRTVRRTVGGHSTDEHKDKADEKIEEEIASAGGPIHDEDPQVILHKFAEAFTRFLEIEMRKMSKHIKARQSRQQEIEQFEVHANKFLDEFNTKRLADSEYKVVAPHLATFVRHGKMIILLASFMFGTFISFLYSILLSNFKKTPIEPEHQQILAQQPISADEFFSDYLRTGEVKEIHIYPKNNAIAIMMPGAFIRGESFQGTGVSVNTSPSSIYNFLSRLVQEQRLLGLPRSELVPVRFHGSSPFFGFFTVMLISPLIFLYSLKYWRPLMQQILFKVVKKGSSS